MQEIINHLKRWTLIKLKKWTSDKIYYQIRHFVEFKRFIDFKNPKTFNEKLNWMKLNDRNPKYGMFVDKFEVRNYIRKTIGSANLNELIGVYNGPEEINFNNLPNSFVLKATHGSDMVLLCKDKSVFNVNIAKETMKSWLKINFYEAWGEFVYAHIKPRLICEKYLSNENEEYLTDYKFFCFHGEPKYIQVYRNIDGVDTVDFYDLEWNHQMFSLLFSKSKEGVVKPKALPEMIHLAKKLSKPFKFIRVDFYVVQDKVYFGELTFYPCNGFASFQPSSIDYELGKLLTL